MITMSIEDATAYLLEQMKINGIVKADWTPISFIAREDDCPLARKIIIEFWLYKINNIEPRELFEAKSRTKGLKEAEKERILKPIRDDKNREYEPYLTEENLNEAVAHVASVKAQHISEANLAEEKHITDCSTLLKDITTKKVFGNDEKERLTTYVGNSMDPSRGGHRFSSPERKPLFRKYFLAPLCVASKSLSRDVKQRIVETIQTRDWDWNSNYGEDGVRYGYLDFISVLLGAHSVSEEIQQLADQAAQELATIVAASAASAAPVTVSLASGASSSASTAGAAAAPVAGVSLAAAAAVSQSSVTNQQAKIGPIAAEATEAPNEFLCPITHELMQDPVVAADGHSYERAAIEEWFAGGHNSSPKTNAIITNTLVPNIQLRTLIMEWLEKQTKRPVVELSI